MRERSLVMVKPDAVFDGRSKEIRDFLMFRGVDILAEKHVWFTPAMLQQFYGTSICVESFEKMVSLFKKSFAVVLVFEGEDAVGIGTETKKLFRRKYDYGYYGCTIHACDNVEEYTKEMEVLVAAGYLF